MRPFTVVLFCSHLPFPGGATPVAGSHGPLRRGGAAGEMSVLSCSYLLFPDGATPGVGSPEPPGRGGTTGETFFSYFVL